MPWVFEDDRPIYYQLMDRIKINIIKGEYKPGDKVPSVREFAKEAGVNPNTMQKALTELENQGFLYSISTSGRFITKDIDLVKNLKEDLGLDKIKKFLNEMESIGYTNEELVDKVKIIIKELN